MKAQEARQKAIEVNASENSEQYVKITQVIRAEADKGGYQAFIDFSVNDDLKKKLEADGFKVKRESDRNQSYTTINW